MSKTNKNSSWSKTISVNGKPKIQTITDEDGNSTSNYIMSPWEKLAYEYAEKEFADRITPAKESGTYSREIYVKLITGDRQNYYYYVSYVGEGVDYWALLINPTTGEVVSKR